MFWTILNTLREGSSKVKTYLISVFVLWIAVIALFISAIVTHSLLVCAAAVILVIITLAVMSNMKLVVTDSRNGTAGQEVPGAKRKMAAPKEGEAEEKEKPEGKKGKKGDVEEDDVQEEPEDPEESENSLASMTEDKLNQLLVKYKVKKEHVPVVIDLCASMRVRQCPGFAWMEGSQLKILLMETKARLVELDTSRLQELYVERGITVRTSAEYAELRDSEVMKLMFSPYLPKYYKKNIGGKIVPLKNLYVLGVDMKFPSGSVGQLLKLLPLRITINDRRMQTSNVSAYYKELFTISFLWKDGVYTLAEFRGKLEELLNSMIEAETSEEQFEKDLSEMITDGLLPLEYRDYVYRLREEAGEPEKKVQKKRRKKKKSGNSGV